ncbi:MAG: hypothetical protein JJU13_16075 [Balneolaceae bacterium]|nr:hypothetical protein [Balneolaceae bacterium]
MAKKRFLLHNIISAGFIACLLVFTACEKDEDDITRDKHIPDTVISTVHPPDTDLLLTELVLFSEFEDNSIT